MSAAPEMRAPAETIRLDGEVGEHPATASQVAARLELAAGGPVTLTVNSPGGSAFEGSAIYSELRAHPGAITIVVRGIAASAASLIAMAGDEIVMAEGAVMMIHDPSALTMGTADAHRETTEVLDKLSVEYASIYAARSGQPLATVRRLMAQETWLTAEEAVAAGFADRVEETENAEPVAAFDYTKFAHAPARLVALARTNGWAPVRPVEAHKEEKNPMSITLTNPADDQTATNPEAEAALAAQQRRDAVMLIPNVKALSAVEIDAIVTMATDPADAKSKAVDAICEKRMQDEPSPTMRANVGHSHDHGEGLRARMIDGLRARMNPAHKPEVGREFATMSLPEMAYHAARAAGLKVASHREAIDAIFRPSMSWGGSHSTSDFATILSGTINQEMAQAYNQQSPALLAASRPVSGPDFRQRVRPRLSTGPDLAKINETGEFTFGIFSETGENAPLVETYGKMFRLTRQAIVNDNLSAFASIPSEMARGAVTTTRTVISAPLLANAGAGQTMLETGDTLFHANHGNLAGTGGALSVTTLGAAQTAMRRQTGLAGEIIDIRPWALVVPPELETVALQVVTSIDATQVTDVNPFAARLEVIVEPALTDTTAWYVTAEPGLAEGLMHSFLDGTNGPRVEERMGWEVDGMEWKVTLDFGAAFTDYRSWYKNAGA